MRSQTWYFFSKNACFMVHYNAGNKPSIALPTFTHIVQNRWTRGSYCARTHTWLFAQVYAKQSAASSFSFTPAKARKTTKFSQWKIPVINLPWFISLWTSKCAPNPVWLPKVWIWRKLFLWSMIETKSFDFFCTVIIKGLRVPWWKIITQNIDFVHLRM